MSVRLLSLLAFCFFTTSTFAQVGEWTWISGDTFGTGTFDYGVQGVEAATNQPPSRYQCAYWTDTSGNFWIFGGYNVLYTQLNDLWRFNPKTEKWTWMSGPALSNDYDGEFGTKGVPSINNYPSGRAWGTNCWTDHENNLWLFGGAGPDGLGNLAYLNDLWKYNIATNEWTWVNGEKDATLILENKGTPTVFSATNSPGAIVECKSSWVSKENRFYMFGGNNSNDMWQYNPAINQYAFMKGDGGLTSNYGILGVESPSNLPPGRWSYTKWQDDDDNFFIFGGGGNSGLTTNYGFNDLWKYNKTTNNWTWITGSQVVDDLGLYDYGKCKPQNSSMPAARFENQTAATLGCNSVFWSFGGFNQNLIAANDLWCYNTETNKWTWVSGNMPTTIQDSGNYGVKGISAPSNLPPGRGGGAIFTDKNFNLWIFGGSVFSPNNGTFTFNDMWRFVPNADCFGAPLFPDVVAPTPSKLNLCQGDSTLIPKINDNIILNIMPASGYSINANGDYVFQPSGPTTYTLIAIDTGVCGGTDTAIFSINVVTLPQATITSEQDIYFNSENNITLTSGSTNTVVFEWYYNGVLVGNQSTLNYQIDSFGEHCFMLVAINALGCADTTIKCITKVKQGYIYMPNIFTPNGDNMNDVLKIIGVDIKIKTFSIFSRWGERVFYTENINSGWDGKFKGKDAEAGTYMYVIEYFDVNSPNKKKLLKGDIILSR